MHTGIKHTLSQRSAFLICFCCSILASSASAQLGPATAEIPQAFIEPAEQDRSAQQLPNNPNPSSSQFVRSAMEEMLMTKAREAAGSVTNDPVQSPVIGTPATPKKTALIGGSTPDKSFSGIDGGYIQTIVALIGVILLILGLGQLYKRLARSQGSLVSQLGAGGSAPSGILEVIGRYPISKGMTLVVLKFDRRVLLVSHASPTRGKNSQAGSMDLLCELTDPEEIASILLKSRSASGDTIAQSFEQTLRQADQLTDEYLGSDGQGYSEVNPVRFPQQHQGQPARTITTDEGDRAELWSSGQDSRAAAGVLRKRLSAMRREQQG